MYRDSGAARAPVRMKPEPRCGGMVEIELKQLVSGTGALPRIEKRVLALEEARLDLRLGALEGAAQHSAVFHESNAREAMALQWGHEP